MRVDTDGIAGLELKLGETMKVFFRSKAGDSRPTLGLTVSTLELLKGEMGLTVAVPSGRTFKYSVTVPLTLLITG